MLGDGAEFELDLAALQSDLAAEALCDPERVRNDRCGRHLDWVPRALNNERALRVPPRRDGEREMRPGERGEGVLGRVGPQAAGRLARGRVEHADVAEDSPFCGCGGAQLFKVLVVFGEISHEGSRISDVGEGGGDEGIGRDRDEAAWEGETRRRDAREDGELACDVTAREVFRRMRLLRNGSKLSKLRSGREGKGSD